MKVSLNTFQLKILAMLFMLIDHIGEFLPHMPLWFRYVGRCSAPLFMFCLVWGLDFTSNRKKYSIRLYFSSVLMGILLDLVNYFGKLEITNNIFSTLFVIGFIINLLFPKTGKRNIKKIIVFGILQVIFVFMFGWFISFFSSGHSFHQLVRALLGNMFLSDGGSLWVLLGVLLYCIKDSKKRLVAGYTCYCVLNAFLSFTALVPRVIYSLAYHQYKWVSGVCSILYHLITQEHYRMAPMVLHQLCFDNFQWLMIMALPIMLLFNRDEGHSVKWFFYVFYPIHILVLVMLSFGI